MLGVTIQIKCKSLFKCRKCCRLTDLYEGKEFQHLVIRYTSLYFNKSAFTRLRNDEFKSMTT